MARGGYRPGSGRRPKVPPSQVPVTEQIFTGGKVGEKETTPQSVKDLQKALGGASEEMVKLVLSHQEELVSAMVALAVGIKREKTMPTPEGEKVIEIYTAPPDRQAIEFLLEFVHGRATQKSEKQTDTQITLRTNIPRPGRSAVRKEEEDTE